MYIVSRFSIVTNPNGKVGGQFYFAIDHSTTPLFHCNSFMLQGISLGCSFDLGFSSCCRLQVLLVLAMYHQLLLLNVYATVIVSQLWVHCNVVTTNIYVQPFMVCFSLIDTFQIHNHGQPM